MKKFKYALRWINKEREFVKTHAVEANSEMEKLYLLQTNSRQLKIIETMAVAIVLLAMFIWFQSIREKL